MKEEFTKYFCKIYAVYVFKSIGHVVLLPAIYILGQSSEYILHLNLIVVIDNQYWVATFTYWKDEVGVGLKFIPLQSISWFQA